MIVMSNESLKSHIESITQQLEEINTMPTSAFKGGYAMAQNISKSLISLRDIYKKELKSRNAE